MNEEVTTEVVGMLYGMPWDKMFEQPRRVHSVDGIAPALNANGGGHLEIKIIVEDGEDNHTNKRG